VIKKRSELQRTDELGEAGGDGRPGEVGFVGLAAALDEARAEDGVQEDGASRITRGCSSSFSTALNLSKITNIHVRSNQYTSVYIILFITVPVSAILPPVVRNGWTVLSRRSWIFPGFSATRPSLGSCLT